MDSNLSTGHLAVAYIFTIASIIICIIQIVMQKKLNLLSVCKVSIFLPIISIIVKATSDTSQAFIDIVRANDLSSKVINTGMANLFQSISIGLILTVILLIFYAITKSVYDNTIEKNKAKPL